MQRGCVFVPINYSLLPFARQHQYPHCLRRDRQGHVQMRALHAPAILVALPGAVLLLPQEFEHRVSVGAANGESRREPNDRGAIYRSCEREV